MSDSRRTYWYIGALIVLAGVALHGAFAPASAVGSRLAADVWFFKEVGGGWNPFWFSGSPSVGQPGNLAGYPFNLLMFVLPEGGFIGLSFFAHVLLLRPVRHQLHQIRESTQSLFSNPWQFLCQLEFY